MQTWIWYKTKIKALKKKKNLYHTVIAANFGGPNLASKCTEPSRVFLSVSTENRHPPSKVVSHMSKVYVHFSVCPKSKWRKVNYRHLNKSYKCSSDGQISSLSTVGCHFYTTGTKTFCTSGSMLRRGLDPQQSSTLCSRFHSWDLTFNVCHQECMPWYWDIVRGSSLSTPRLKRVNSHSSAFFILKLNHIS